MKEKFIITKDFLIKELNINKKTAKDLTKEIGCSYSTLRRRFKEYGIKLRENKKYFCIDCKAEILRGRKRCKACDRKWRRERFSGKNSPSYKKGLPFCIDCGCQLKSYEAKRCKECYVKFMIKENKYRGRNNPSWKEPLEVKCLFCGRIRKFKPWIAKKRKFCNSICRQKYWVAEMRKRRTRESFKKISKALKEKWKDENFRNIMVKKVMKSLSLKSNLVFPNKCEIKLKQIIDEILPNMYKYIGDGEIIIERFNPDFININGQKKIIELFGDYWHNLPGCERRDKKRLKVYKKYGYDTLIIWEHELNDIEKLRKKILEFHNK